MKDGFMFVIVENQMDNLRFIENGFYAGSKGLTRLGEDPDELDYEIDALPGVDGVIFKVCLNGYGTSSRVSS